MRDTGVERPAPGALFHPVNRVGNAVRRLACRFRGGFYCLSLRAPAHDHRQKQALCLMHLLFERLAGRDKARNHGTEDLGPTCQLLRGIIHVGRVRD